MTTGLAAEEAAALAIAHDGVARYRAELGERPVPAQAGLDDAMALFRQPLPDSGTGAEEVISQPIRDADPGLCQMASPNFYGFVLGGSHPVGVAADMLCAGWGQNAGSAAMTPAISGMERAVCDWVVDLLGLPAESGAGLVTGASVANMVAVMAARHALLEAQGWNVEENGLFGAPPIPVLIGEHAHSAPFAALRYAGLGAGRAIRIATDEAGRVLPEALQEALENCEAPPLVILQAGQINTGSFDRFARLIPMVREKKGWVHVDGAFGLWLAAVPELAPRLGGVEDADSWAVDLHKWLSAPFDAGMAICRDRAPLVASMTARGAYLPDLTEHWEPPDSTPELSRRARGVPSYAIMRHLGRAGVRELVARHCRLAAYLGERLAAEDGITVLNEITSNQVAIRCGNGPAADEQTNAVLAKVQQRGKVYPSHGVWHGGAIIRASIINYATQQEHVDLLAAEIISAWREIRDN